MQTGLPVTLGRFTFDPAAGTLSMDGNSTVLPSREAALLFLLSSHIGETVPNPIILKNIWNGDDYFTTRSLNVHITRLRKTLADDARIVALRQSVREAAESKLRNGIIDTNDLLQKITDEATARSAKSVHEIELLKAQYELKHLTN